MRRCRDAAVEAVGRRVADQIMHGLIHLTNGIRRRVSLQARARVHAPSPVRDIGPASAFCLRSKMETEAAVVFTPLLLGHSL